MNKLARNIYSQLCEGDGAYFSDTLESLIKGLLEEAELPTDVEHRQAVREILMFTLQTKSYEAREEGQRRRKE